MLEALLAGEERPELLADLARGRLRAKLPQVRQALEGRVQAQHRVLLRHVLAHLDFIEQHLYQLTQEIEAALTPMTDAIIAEIGTDMRRFPSAKRLASWAGVCPGNRQSAGKRLGGRTTNGNPWLRAALGEVTWSLAHTANSYLAAQYHRFARRIGKHKAIVAVSHSLLGIIYHLLATHSAYSDLGPDYFDSLENDRLQRHYVRRLEQLGFAVTLTSPQTT